LNAPSFKIETPKSLATIVAQRLREAIIDGEFALGAMIPEESLATSFGVSRTPVREALNQLQLLGLVSIRPQRGSYVFEASEADIAALCEFRCVMEPRAAELAWAHDREATLVDLNAAVADMAAAR
jgi:DNA-binding GntR family transcriptional regulator